MNWEDEAYIKTYTRDTAEWVALAWQAKALACLMLRKVDRAGVIQLRDGPNRVRLLSGLVGLPLDVTGSGLADLLADGCVVESVAGFCFPNFIEAQEARTSDKQRQANSRAARRDRASVTKRDTQSQNVTESHSTSQHVTGGHTASHRVTNRIEELRPDQTRTEEEDGARARVATSGPGSEAPKDPPPLAIIPAVVAQRLGGAVAEDLAPPATRPDVATKATISTQRAPSGGPAAPTPPKPNLALPHPEVTYSDVRDLWQAVRKRPGVRLREWPEGWPMKKQILFDPVIQQRPVEGPTGWRAVMDALSQSTLFNGSSPGTPELLLDRNSKGTIASLLAGHYRDEPAQPPAPKPDPHRDDQSRWIEREKAHFAEKAAEAARNTAD